MGRLHLSDQSDSHAHTGSDGWPSDSAIISMSYTPPCIAWVPSNCFNSLPVCLYFLQVSSWGGYVFLINLIPMHTLALMVTGRFSHRIYVVYTTVYCLGTILSMQISFVGFQPVQSSEHMAVSTLWCPLVNSFPGIWLITLSTNFQFLTFVLKKTTEISI